MLTRPLSSWILYLGKSWMSSGQTGSCSRHVTCPWEGRVPPWPAPAPDAVTMPWWSFSSPLLSPETPRQSSVGSTRQNKKQTATFRHPDPFFPLFAIAKAAQNEPFICSTEDCARILHVVWSGGWKSPDSRYWKKAWRLKSVPRASHSELEAPGLVCACMCPYLETDGLPADWDLKWGPEGDDNTRGGFLGGT